jgi:hypothetical protein
VDRRLARGQRPGRAAPVEPLRVALLHDLILAQNKRQIING